MPKVTDEQWKCPKCLVGYDEGNGLCGDEYTTWEEARDAEGAANIEPKAEYGYCECMACGWNGTTKQVYNAAMKRAGRVKCSCCKGTGWVAKV